MSWIYDGAIVFLIMTEWFFFFLDVLAFEIENFDEE